MFSKKLFQKWFCIAEYYAIWYPKTYKGFMAYIDGVTTNGHGKVKFIREPKLTITNMVTNAIL